MEDNLKNGRIVYDIDEGIIKKRINGQWLELPNDTDSSNTSVKRLQLPSDTGISDVSSTTNTPINNIIRPAQNYVNNLQENFTFPTNEQLKAMENKKIISYQNVVGNYNEEMSFYDLQYNGYYEDTSLAIENYIKETYDLKGKDLNIYVEDSRVSESKYIRIEDENDEVAEIRLSTHLNNETHPDYQKQVFYNKNDSIDEVERMIDEAVKEVLKSTFKYNVEKSKQPLYNQERGGIGGKEQRRTDRTPNKNKDESKSDRQDIRDVRHKEITNEGDNEYRDFSRNWNDDNRRKNITYNSEREESGKQLYHIRM